MSLAELHHQPQLAWRADESQPSLVVTSTFAVPVELKLRAVIGGTVVDWTQQAWVDAETSDAVLVAVPGALLSHPEADGMPITVFGTAHTGFQSVAVPPWNGIVRRSTAGTVVEQGAWEGPIPWREGLYPRRAAHRARVGRPAHDDSDDTGLAGGAP